MYQIHLPSCSRVDDFSMQNIGRNLHMNAMLSHSRYLAAVALELDVRFCRFYLSLG